MSGQGGEDSTGIVDVLLLPVVLAFAIGLPGVVFTAMLYALLAGVEAAVGLPFASVGLAEALGLPATLFGVSPLYAPVLGFGAAIALFVYNQGDWEGTEGGLPRIHDRFR